MRSISQLDGQVITAETDAPIHDAPRLEGKGSPLPQALLFLLSLTMALVSPWALKRVDVEAQGVTIFTGVQHIALGFGGHLSTNPEALGLGFRLLVTRLLVMTNKRFLDTLYQLFKDSARELRTS